MPIMRLEDVSYSYDKKKYAVKNITLSIKEGEYVAIIGHNGSGKSTLAKLFNGLFQPDAGDVIVEDINSKDKQRLFDIRKKVGVVFQNPDNQLVASIVEDDIAFGPENLGVKREEIGERIDYALKSVGMENYKKASPTRLSGGQKQRIAIAGVLALKPEILVLDESTSMLDPKGRKEVLEVVRKLNKEQKVTIITITHYMEEVVEADRVIVMNEGEIVLSGTPEEIFSSKERIKGYGLELPLANYIAEKLSEEGINLNRDILTDKQLFNGLKDELCK